MQEDISFNDNAAVRVLDNGLTITFEHLPHLHSVSCGVWIRTGSANEQEKQAGVSHFLEHLFFKGTTTRNPRQIMEPIESKGGHLNAFTSREYTCLYSKTLGRQVRTAIEVLSDLIKNSTFADLDKERNVILEEIASQEDVPEDLINDLLAAKMWPEHPLGRSVSGYEWTVLNTSLDDVRDYYRRWYQPQNMFISVAGKFDEQAVLDQIQNEFGWLESIPQHVDKSAPEFSSGIEVVARDIAQNHVCLGFPGPTLGSPERYVYDVMWSALGGGTTSRLFQRVREDEGLAYSIYTFHGAYFKAGMFGVYSAFAPESYDRTMELTFEEIRKFRDELLSDQEIDDNREHLKGSMLMSMENPFNRMSRMAKSMMYYGRIIPLREILSEVDAVTPERVQRVSQEIFRPETCAMLLLGPEIPGLSPDIML